LKHSDNSSRFPDIYNNIIFYYINALISLTEKWHFFLSRGVTLLLYMQSKTRVLPTHFYLFTGIKVVQLRIKFKLYGELIGGNDKGCYFV